ncbi:hypothetical protein GRI75_03795 [Altererythrobacter soli]|uniref:Acid phosphatase n=1 Tax=Croceibacterium soli TaxID=1739690 RepID=A0A6I4USV3_9SPHN|nr:hypothetical protein [Croceibacterium soli]MXP40769.1 hypothetical protein [Croceibacterium soli]
MIGRQPGSPLSERRRAWLALGLLPLLSGCLGAVALPLLAGGAFMVRDKHRVRAATEVPSPDPKVTLETEQAREAVGGIEPGTGVEITSLRELPPPSGAVAAAPVSERWEQFFAYTASKAQPAAGEASRLQSALLQSPPSIDAPVRRECPAQFPAVVIDLDDRSTPFAPERLSAAPAGTAEGLARLRAAGITVLWISRLPAGRAGDVARALRASGLDPQGQDQLLLLRSGEDRKQVLRQEANLDVCVVAIAGDERSDFDELFDYLRDPDGAVGLYPMMGDGWFLVPSLTDPGAEVTE